MITWEKMYTRCILEIQLRKLAEIIVTHSIAKVFQGREIAIRDVVLPLNGAENIRHVVEELLLLGSLAKNRRHLILQIAYEKSVHLYMAGAFHKLVDL